MSDEEFQPIYCRWAAERYGLSDVAHVGFDVAEGRFGGSDVTPPDPWHFEVKIRLASGERVEKSEHDAAEVIRSIVALTRKMA